MVIKEKILIDEAEAKKVKEESEKRDDYQTPLLLFATFIFGDFILSQVLKK